jgi:hypothetical protein
MINDKEKVRFLFTLKPNTSLTQGSLKSIKNKPQIAYEQQTERKTV